MGSVYWKPHPGKFPQLLGAVIGGAAAVLLIGIGLGVIVAFTDIPSKFLNVFFPDSRPIDPTIAFATVGTFIATAITSIAAGVLTGWFLIGFILRSMWEWFYED